MTRNQNPNIFYTDVEIFCQLMPLLLHVDVLNAAGGVGNGVHYENTPIQIYKKFQLQKLKNFR